MKKSQSNKVDKKQAELERYLEFAELVSELGDAVDRYYPEDLALRTRTIITPLMFKNESDYKYFISRIDEFFREYAIMLQESKISRMTGKGIGGDSQQKTLNIINDLSQKYPEQLNSFVLSHVSIERDTPYVISACLRFLKNKNAYTERFTQDENGYKYIEISSTEELGFDFLSKEYHERDDIGDGLRKLTKDEYDFLTRTETVSAIEFLAPQDFVYCAKSPKYAGALFYNLASYNDFAHGKDYTETQNSIITLIKSNIQYLNLSKLKMLMLCRAIVFAEQLGITMENSDSKYAEDIVKELLELLKSSKGTKINSNGISIDVVDWGAIDFEVREQRKENTIRSNPPIYIFGPNSRISKMNVKTELNIDMTTRDVISSAESFLEKREINRFLEKFEQDKIDGFKFDLRNIGTVKSLRTMIYTRAKEKNPDLDTDEIEDICFEYAKNLAKCLYTQKYVDVFELRRFDESAVCELIYEGAINISDLDLFKGGFSRQAIIYLCCVQPERIENCLDKKYITKDDLLSAMHIPNSVIINLFNKNQLSIKEILDLVAQKKVVVAQLSECEFSQELINEQLDPLFLAQLYMDVLKGKVDYETKVKDHIESAIEQGISEDDIPAMDGEQELQNGIQILVEQKEAYLNFVNLSQLKGKDKDKFLELVFTEAFSSMEYQDFCRVAEEMYKDGLIDMDLIRRLEPSIIVELIKSFAITTEDLEKFKNTAVTDEEIAELREICDSEEEYQEEFDDLKYKKLKDIIDAIVKDPSISQEEKLGIIYNVYSLNTEIEEMFVEYYQDAILKDEFETKFEKIKETYGKTAKVKKKRNPKPDNDKTPINENNFVYPAKMIWNFMRLLDPNVDIKVLKDGNVTFCSKKLDKAMIESVWNGSGKGVKRSYGTATISMDLNTFNNNSSHIVVPARKGYRIDTLAAKDVLPTVQTKKGIKRLGLIRHDKDLKHTGKKIWFELLLDNFGIKLDDIREGRDSRYTPEDAEKIEQFIKVARDSHERI